MTAVLDGTRSVVNDATGISDRVRHGDPLCGWEGDESYTLYYKRGEDEPFQVWGLNAERVPYHVLSAERCDHRILHRLRDSHWSNMKRRNREFKAELDAQEVERKKADAELDREGIVQIAHALGDHRYTWGYEGGGDHRATRRLHS